MDRSQELVSSIVEENLPGKKIFTTEDLFFVVREALREGGREYLLKEKTSRRSTQRYRDFVKLVLSRNLANYDSMVLITAQKGGGKSTAAIDLAREWCSLLGIKFDLKKHIAYSNADLSYRIDTLPPFSPLVADESIRFISSEDWNKKENKVLKKKLAQVREKHLFFLMCFPMKVKKVEKNYLDSFVNYWIELFVRGYGALFLPDLNPVHDRWRLDFFKKMGAYNEFTEPREIERKLRRHPNFWELMFFDKLPLDIENKYLAYREANVYKDDSESVNIRRDEVFRSAMLLTLSDIITQDTRFTLQRIRTHVKNNYDVKMSDTSIRGVIDDARRVINNAQKSISTDSDIVEGDNDETEAATQA